MRFEELLGVKRFDYFVVITTNRCNLHCEHCIVACHLPLNPDTFDEVVLVDNGSFDGTVEKTEELFQELNLNGQIYRVETHSLGDSRREAVENASNDWILLSDANMVYGDTLKNVFRQLIQRERQGNMPSLNLIGDYRHYFTLRKLNSPHLTLFRRSHIKFAEGGDRPRLPRRHRASTVTPWAVNLSRVRPAWRCWYRGEPFLDEGTWKGPSNRQYHWLVERKHPSLVEYVEETEGLSLTQVKEKASKWFLRLLQEYAKPLPPDEVDMLPAVVREELKNPRYRLTYKEGRIAGRAPSL